MNFHKIMTYSVDKHCGMELLCLFTCTGHSMRMHIIIFSPSGPRGLRTSDSLCQGLPWDPQSLGTYCRWDPTAHLTPVLLTSSCCVSHDEPRHSSPYAAAFTAAARFLACCLWRDWLPLSQCEKTSANVLKKQSLNTSSERDFST